MTEHRSAGIRAPWAFRDARPLRAAGALLAAGTLIAASTVVAGCASNSGGKGEAAQIPTLPSTLPVTSGGTITMTPTQSSRPASSGTDSGSPGANIKQAPTTPARQVTVTSTDGTRTYAIDIWWQVNTTDCADHAYGNAVTQYLTAHPCEGMTRLLATTSVGGKAVGFAETNIAFIGNAPAVYQTAGNFATLEEEDGTGSVNDLLREGYRLPSGPSRLPSPDAFDVQAQDSGVTIVDAFYLNGRTPNNDRALVQMAQDIFLQF